MRANCDFIQSNTRSTQSRMDLRDQQKAKSAQHIELGNDH